RGSGQHELASGHDRAQVPHQSVIARRATTRTPTIRLKLLQQRHEPLAPPPASVPADLTYPAAAAARPALPAQWSVEALYPALANDADVMPPHAADPRRCCSVAAAVNAERGLEVAPDVVGDGGLHRAFLAEEGFGVPLRSAQLIAKVAPLARVQGYR